MPNPNFHLAQINIAKLRESIDHPLIADFVSQLDIVNAAGEASPGFVWRFKDDSGNASGIQVFDDPKVIINYTVWESIDSLMAFAYRNPDHVAVFRKREKWFEKMNPSMVLWWIPAGHIPTLAEAKEKLDLIGKIGPSADAFDFRNRFEAENR